MKQPKHLLFLGWLSFTLLLWALSSGAQNGESVEIASINFFGAQGQDLSALLHTLPIHSGDKLRAQDKDRLLRNIEASVLSSFGKPATDVVLMCCDTPSHVDLYIGLPGDSYVSIHHTAPPTGSAKLPPDALALIHECDTEWNAAISRGNSSEDDSKGFALSNDPALHVVQMKIRAYALAHEDLAIRVLRESGDADQRQIAATFVGYTRRSPPQIDALSAAANDSDDAVRNNAIRALGVLSSTAPLEDFDASPFIRMLFSGSWSDRNKSSALLMRLTASRDPKLLSELRRSALPALLDGASWHSSGHASAFLLILGRIGNIPEDKLSSPIDSGTKDQILSAAERSAGHIYTQERHD